MIWTIPNTLTVGRILAAPGLVLAFVAFDRPTADWVAFWLFALAAITDFFDGWLARRLDQITEVGKMLDPIADKAMVIIALSMIMVTYSQDPEIGLNGLVAVPATAIILREVLVSGLREYLGDVKLPVTRLAKWKTTIQMVAIGMLLFVTPFFGWSPGKEDSGMPFVFVLGVIALGGIGLLWLAALLTLITGWDYFRKGLAYIRAKEED